eukprot:5567515-Pleurochrysis_carterae.AAC.1
MPRRIKRLGCSSSTTSGGRGDLPSNASSMLVCAACAGADDGFWWSHLEMGPRRVGVNETSSEKA